MQSFVILWLPGPRWVMGAPIYEQPFIEEHADRIGQLQSEHRIVLSGPFTLPVGTHSSPAGMTIVTAMAEEDLHAWLAEDPAIVHEVAAAEVFPFQIVFGAQGASTGTDHGTTERTYGAAIARRGQMGSIT